jgi:hypothetical protein
LLRRLALLAARSETERQLITLAAVMRLCGIGDAGIPYDMLGRAMILLSFAREVGVDDLQINRSMVLRLAEAGPLNAALFYRQGLRLLASGRHLNAQQQFRKAIAADPLSSAVQRELAKLEKLPVPTAHRSAS